MKNGNVHIRQKYANYRQNAKDGDILLWKGNSFLSRAIRFFDDRYINDEGEKVKDPAVWNHTSLVYWGRGERLHNADSWFNGITVVPASHRLDSYVDFCVLRPYMEHVVHPESQIEEALKFVLDEWKANVPYDYFTLPRIALIKRTGIDITGLGKKAHYICSEFTQAFTLRLGIDDYHRRELFTPQDHIRHNAGSFQLLYNEPHK